MLSISLSEEQQKKLHSGLLSTVEPPEGWEVQDYYGIITMKYKKDSSYQIKLIYDYGKDAITSSPIKIKNMDQFFTAVYILEKNNKHESDMTSIEDIFKNINEEEISEPLKGTTSPGSEGRKSNGSDF